MTDTASLNIELPPGGRVTLVINGANVYDHIAPGVPVSPPVNPPVNPPITPPVGGSCSGPNDLSDAAEHRYQFAEGQWQTFCFRSPGGFVDFTVVAVANTTAKVGNWIVNGGPQQGFKPSGSDFRFKPIQGDVASGVTQVAVAITGILGEGRFMLQAVGAVGP